MKKFWLSRTYRLMKKTMIPPMMENQRLMHRKRFSVGRINE